MGLVEQRHHIVLSRSIFREVWQLQLRFGNAVRLQHYCELERIRPVAARFQAFSACQF